MLTNGKESVSDGENVHKKKKVNVIIKGYEHQIQTTKELRKAEREG